MRNRLAASISLLLTVALAAQQEPGAFRAHALFSDHMVVPPDSTLPLRGDGAAGAMVRVRASWGAESTVTTGRDGRWRCNLPTPPRGTTGEIVLTCGTASVTVRDVVVGDVWLASGQSNMEMPVGKNPWSAGVRDHEAVAAAADLPQLRVFTVPQVASDRPLDTCAGRWIVCSPATAAAFSATAFFFGRDLLAAGKGPIGLVVSSWGGTIAEAWVRDSGLAAFPEFAPALAARQAGAAPSLDVLRQRFWAALPVTAPNGQAVLVQVPDLWSRSGLQDFDGVAFYQRELALPEAFRGKACWLELGALDDMDTVWWGDQRLAGSEQDGAWATARRYEVPADRTAVAAAVLRLRLVDTGGEGGFSGRADDVRLVLASDPTQVLPLAGPWSRTTGPELAKLPQWPRNDGGPNRPAVLWNGMIAPLLPFPFTGAIWYQGESNRHRHDQYARLFPALIQDWRRAGGNTMPFYFVQIAPYGYRDERGETTPLLRQAQAAALALPGTGMVVTLDCGDAGDIHPIDKQPVGARLALLARAKHYGDDVVCEGPRAVAAERSGEALRITFAEPVGGLRLLGDGGGFEVAGADGRFVPAVAKVEGDAVRVRADGIAVPQHVRYAWAAVPQWSLANGAALPAAPFHLSIP